MSDSTGTFSGGAEPSLPPHKNPEWFGDGTDLPKMRALGLGSVSFPDWAVHSEWGHEVNSEDVPPPDVRPPYSTEDRKHEWQRESIKLPPIKQKQQRRKITKAEQPFWFPKPEKSFKSSNTKAVYKIPEDDVQMFNLISMQYQKDWIGLTKNREVERVRKSKQLKVQQKAKLLNHAVKSKTRDAGCDDLEKEPFKLTRFSNIPSRYLDSTT